MSGKKNTVAILMSIRNEESFIDFNISYHLDIGFDYIFITNHCSTDNTKKILDSYKNDPRVIVIEEKDSVFDHAKIINKLLNYVNTHYKIDWFIFLDADEFLSISDGSVHDFVARLDDNGIPYATIGWANALFDHTFSDYTCSPVNTIDTTKYYYPWPEKEWQEYGHFRKAIVRNHENMEIVVGGHYVETRNNIDFFGEYHWNPFIIPKNEARLLHFEFRGKADEIYKKWEKLASFENDSSSNTNSPWLERIRMIRKYVKDFKDNLNEINKRWFFEHRTFWGTIITEDKIIYDNTMCIWYRKYFRKKIESGKIKSVCLVRTGNLGDVVMTEPIARFLSKYVNKIYLATDIKNAESMFGVYNKVYEYSQIGSGKINCDIMIRLVYELSDNKKTYIQGYMESIGFSEIINKDTPVLNNSRDGIIGEEYILIAPFTSGWEEKKRNWGYKKFVELSNRLSTDLNIKCIMLEKHYSFGEMISLIEHCKFFIGNDSGPAIIAQSFKKKSFVIFGATRPEYIHMSKYTVSIYDKERHKLCNHSSRREEIECCEEFCMDRISINQTFEIIKSNI
ncbi:MAG: glycosyltransferase family 2 protein [Candidatus Paceibacterota bacterium]